MNTVNSHPDRSYNEDSDLIGAFQAGEKSAFDDLVRKHQDRIFNLCYWLLGDYQEADDCAQDTFIKIFRNVAKFRFESTFLTWAHRIAVNTCKNRLKSFHYRFSRKLVRRDNSGRSPGSVDAIADETGSPEMARIVAIAVATMRNRPMSTFMMSCARTEARIERSPER